MEMSSARSRWFWGIGAALVLVALGFALYAKGWVGGSYTPPAEPVVQQTD